MSIKEWLLLELMMLSQARKTWLVVGMGAVIAFVAAVTLHNVVTDYSSAPGLSGPLAPIKEEEAFGNILAAQYERGVKGLAWAVLTSALLTYLKERKKLKRCF